MAGVIRIHNKLHGASHHTLSTAEILDSGTDPIAHPLNPYSSDFFITSELSSDVKVSSITAAIDNAIAQNLYATTIDSFILAASDSITANSIVSYQSGGINITNFQNSTNNTAFSGFNNVLYTPTIRVNDIFTCNNLQCETAFLTANAQDRIVANTFVSNFNNCRFYVKDVSGLTDIINNKSTINHKHYLSKLLGGEVFVNQLSSINDQISLKSNFTHTHVLSDIANGTQLLTALNRHVFAVTSVLSTKAEAEHIHALSSIIDYNTTTIDELCANVNNKAEIHHTHTLSTININPLTSLYADIDKHIGYMQVLTSAIQTVYFNISSKNWYDVDSWFTLHNHAPLNRIPNAYEAVVLYGELDEFIVVDIDDARWVQPFSIDTGISRLIVSSNLSAVITCSVSGEIEFIGNAQYDTISQTEIYDPGFILYDNTYQHQLSDVKLPGNVSLPDINFTTQGKSPKSHTHVLSSDFNLNVLDFLNDLEDIQMLETSAANLFSRIDYLENEYRSIDFVIDYINETCDDINKTFTVSEVNIAYSDTLGEHTSGYNQLQHLASIVSSPYISQEDLKIYKKLYDLQTPLQGKKGIFQKLQRVNRYSAIIPTSIYNSSFIATQTEYTPYLWLFQNNYLYSIIAYSESIPYLIYNKNRSNLQIQNIVINSNAYMRSVIQSPTSAYEVSDTNYTILHYMV